VHYTTSWQPVLSAVSQAQSWSTLVDGESLNRVGKVYRTLTHVDGVLHATQVELNAAVNQKPVELLSCFRAEAT